MPPFNNRFAAREAADAFERRFTRIGDGTLFLESDGSAVRVPDDVAAHLIAAMRATVADADAQTRLKGDQVGWAMLGAAGGTVLLGAGLGLPGLGCALAVPAAVAVVLLGPGLGAMRIDAAARDGLARARHAMRDYERVDAGDRHVLAPPNRIRPIVEVTGLLLGAVVLGLLLAYVTMPFYARVGMDRALARFAPTVLLATVVLVFVSRARDAVTRRRVPEVAIGEAMTERGNRPFR